MQKEDSGCDVVKLFDLLGKKWTYGLLHNISKDPVTFNILIRMSQREINPTLLSKRLKKLIEFNIIEKKVCNEDKCRVCYSITKEGEKLKETMYLIKQWAEETGCKMPDGCKGETCAECKIFKKNSAV